MKEKKTEEKESFPFLALCNCKKGPSINYGDIILTKNEFVKFSKNIFAKKGRILK